MLTIVIVNWNGGDLLSRCLRSIRDSRTSLPVKVIVVDNDSHDGSREKAQKEFPDYDIFNSGSNLGFGRGNNLARNRTDTPFLLFLNPDTELKPDTLEKMQQLMNRQPEIGAACCLMRYPDGEVQEQGLQWYPTPFIIFVELLLANRTCRRLFHRWLPRLDPLRSSYIKKIYGGFVFARRTAFDQAGWFDERYFMYAEDVDLSRTMTSLGWKIFYTAETEAIHVCGGTSAKAPSGFSVLMKNESIAKYMRKYYGATGEFFYRIAIFTAAAIRFLPAAIASLVSSSSDTRWKDSKAKQSIMLSWALGLKKPIIAQSPQPAHGLSMEHGTTH